MLAIFVIFAIAGDLHDIFFAMCFNFLNTSHSFWLRVPVKSPAAQVNKMLPLLIESYNLMKNSSSEDKAAAGDTDVEDPKSHPRLQDGCAACCGSILSGDELQHGTGQEGSSANHVVVNEF